LSGKAPLVVAGFLSESFFDENSNYHRQVFAPLAEKRQIKTYV